MHQLVVDLSGLPVSAGWLWHLDRLVFLNPGRGIWTVPNDNAGEGPLKFLIAFVRAAA